MVLWLRELAAPLVPARTVPGGSQSPVTLAPGDLLASSGAHTRAHTLASVHIRTHR